MNNELTVVEEKKASRHQAGRGCRNALRNSSIDGHEFLSDVVGSGASAALVSDSPRAINSLRDLSLLQVQDTLTKLHKLAPSYRRLMPQRPFRGHKFSKNVVRSGVIGASTALVSDSPRAINSLRDLSLLQVQDTLTKLHKLAPSYRRLMPQRPFRGHKFSKNVVGSGVIGASTALVSDSPRAINSLRDLSLLQVQDTLTKLHKLAPSYRRLMPQRPFRGHKFSKNVVGSGVIGASTALVSDSPRAINSLRDLSLLQVQDTLTKLHKLAPSYRRLMPQRPFRGHKFSKNVVGSGVIGASTALVSDSPRAINSLRDLSLLQVQDTLTKLHKLAPSYRRLMPQRPFRGHKFSKNVVGSGVIGASTALVSDSPRAINSLRDLSLLQVQDTLTKLHKLAPSYRRLMPQRPFRGHKFSKNVVGSGVIGASTALVSDSPRAINSLRDLSLLQVQDTLTKLHKLAPNYRRLMPQRPFSWPVLPASNGKSTSQDPVLVLGNEFLSDVVG